MLSLEEAVMEMGDNEGRAIDGESGMMMKVMEG
jgi:hypothetical protein